MMEVQIKSEERIRHEAEVLTQRHSLIHHYTLEPQRTVRVYTFQPHLNTIISLTCHCAKENINFVALL